MDAMGKLLATIRQMNGTIASLTERKVDTASLDAVVATLKAEVDDLRSSLPTL